MESIQLGVPNTNCSRIGGERMTFSHYPIILKNLRSFCMDVILGRYILKFTIQCLDPRSVKQRCFFYSINFLNNNLVDQSAVFSFLASVLRLKVPFSSFKGYPALWFLSQLLPPCSSCFDLEGPQSFQSAFIRILIKRTVRLALFLAAYSDYFLFYSSDSDNDALKLV